jgi:Ran GTPase-activating protein (RanGAP) involved in mRNA processing and transport
MKCTVSGCSAWSKPGTLYCLQHKHTRRESRDRSRHAAGNPAWKAIDASNKEGAKSLLLKDMKIGDEGAAKLAALLECNASFEKMDLTNTGITDTGAAAIAEALRCNNKLRSIDFRSNKLSAKGLERIKTALEDNDTLTDIFLSFSGESSAVRQQLLVKVQSNRVAQAAQKKKKHAAALATRRALEQVGSSSSSATDLDLHSKNLGDDDANVAQLAAALGRNTTLQTIDLRDNCFGGDAMRLLGDAFCANHCLSRVDLQVGLYSAQYNPDNAQYIVPIVWTMLMMYRTNDVPCYSYTILIIHHMYHTPY